MNWHYTKPVIAACLCIVALSSCGKPKESNGTVPSPVDPTPSTSPTPVTAPPAVTPDSRLPDLTGAVNINLADKVTYKGLEDLSGNVFLPLVGDAKIRLQLTNTRSTSIEGNVLLAFEDKMGFWGAQLPSFPKTGYHNANSVDIIFADSELVVRTVGTLTGDDMTGSIYYRLKQPGETACVQVQVTCEIIDYGFSPFGNTTNNYYCNYPVPDTATPCRAYMNLSNSEVKPLGTFRGKYSQFAILSEDN